MRRFPILKPAMTWWWYGSDETSDSEGTIDGNNNSSAADDTELQPAKRAKDVPVEDEKGEFDENVSDIAEPVRDKAQLKRNVRLVSVGREAAYLEKGITQSDDERHVPKVSTEPFI